MFGAILFSFVWCFHFVTLAFVKRMTSASQYDSRRHGNDSRRHGKDNLAVCVRGMA